MAGKELMKDLELALRSKWACYHLSEIYCQDGYTAKAMINDRVFVASFSTAVMGMTLYREHCVVSG